MDQLIGLHCWNKRHSPFLIWYASPGRRGLGNLMFPLWFVFLGGSFVFLDVDPSNFFLVFPFFWVLWFIYGWQGFIKDIHSRIGFQSLSNVQVHFFHVNGSNTQLNKIRPNYLSTIQISSITVRLWVGQTQSTSWSVILHKEFITHYVTTSEYFHFVILRAHPRPNFCLYVWKGAVFHIIPLTGHYAGGEHWQ